jgi:cytochrome b-561
VLVWCVHFRGGLALRSQNKQLIFNVHPVLMLLGSIVLAGEAILCYCSLLLLVRGARKKAHLALHAAGGLGVYAVLKYHVESGIPNLCSLHSWFGTATISLYALQWVAGFLAFFLGASPATRRSAVPWHAVAGLLVFALAVATA